jgi:uncharacterized membrane protein YgdD (TMEM256/DUF423 family)
MLLTLCQKWLLLLSASLGFISVAAGAFGSHALKSHLAPEKLAVFEVAARYQMYHALAMGLALFASTLLPGAFAPLSGWLFFAGTLIFSGSLYLFVFTGMRIFGAITPIGGLLLLLAWLCLALSSFQSLRDPL